VDFAISLPPPTEDPSTVSRVALVTGGAVRVGRALSLGFAEAGFDVVVHYNTSGRAAREVENKIVGLGRRALLAPGDVSESGDIARIADQVEREFGRLDVLVNSASNFYSTPVMEVTESEWDQVMAVNLKAPFLMAQAAAPMLQRSRGCIVNILDLSAVQAWTSYPHHAVSKAGLLHLTRILAKAMAPHVRVNAVAPGTVLPPESFDPEALERERRRTPLGKLGTPQDVVRTVLFLQASPFITGEMILVDGGRHL
jgi:NAD(P)-dependent dehydrogenase (short-subunit alcohol dehydrogenase family)